MLKSSIDDLRDDREAADAAWSDARLSVRYVYAAELFVLAVIFAGVWFLTPNMVVFLAASALLRACRAGAIRDERTAFHRARACALSLTIAEQDAMRSILLAIRRRPVSGVHPRGLISKAWN